MHSGRIMIDCQGGPDGLRTRKGTVVAKLTACVIVLIVVVRELKATWINPVTGERRDAGTHLTGNLNGQVFPEARTQYFSTPGHWEDALLLLEALR